MNPLRSQAFRMRLAGKSYNEITLALGVAKSTQHSWFRGLVLNESARARLNARVYEGTLNGLVRRNKLQTKQAERRAKEVRREGKKAVTRLTKRDLKIVGATLYWAEGHKRLRVIGGKERMAHTIRFVNADGEMVGIFIKFLQEIYKISEQDIRLTMRLYAHINEEEARRYWMVKTGLGKERFFKTSFQVSGASKGIRPFNRLPYGTLSVEVCSTEKFHHLMGLIEGVKTGF